MVKSMTGYGRAQEKIGALDVLIEMRSVNHRYLDCNIRVPRTYTFLEEPIKKLVSKALSRGKCDVFVTIDRTEAQGGNITLNRTVLEGYLEVLRTLRTEYGLKEDWGAATLARLPDVIGMEREQEDTEALTQEVEDLARRAIAGFDQMRTAEGLRLAEDIGARLDAVEALVDQVEARAPQRVEEYRSRLKAHMDEVLDSAGIDEQRILQEAALYADRVAVDEETVRLKSHLAQLRQMLAGGGAIGRKMDFLIQELNREANTIGSKANDVELSSVVVEIKSEIEKIREQAQNVE